MRRFHVNGKAGVLITTRKNALDAALQYKDQYGLHADEVYPAEEAPESRAEATRFWMVYGNGQGRPTYQHRDPKTAWDEARRLSRANPGVEFFVLEAVGGLVVSKTPPRAITMVDELPF